jgi:hypothetical protein
MVLFEDLKSGTSIYIVDTDPLAILELNLLGVFYTGENQKRLKVSNSEISFEMEYDDIASKLYTDKDLAYSVAVKYVFDSTNKFIRDLTEGYFNNYFELNESLEKYKMIHPELFV